MSERAQTNVQLFRQVMGSEWSDADLLRLRAAYEEATWAFSGQLRGNGKTQIAHHVGTASALALTGHRPDVVIAGMVHSLYFLGEYGTGRRGAHPEKRDRARALLGPEIEALVDAYTALEWTVPAIARMTATAADSSSSLRDCIALRVANEIDEVADGVGRLPGSGGEPALVGDEAVDAIAAVADAHGYGSLSAMLRSEHAESIAAPIPEWLVTPGHDTVFVPPASHRRRLHIALQDSRVGHAVAESVPGARTAAVWVRRRIG